MLSSPIVASSLAPNLPAPFLPLSSCFLVGDVSSCSGSAHGGEFLPFLPRTAPLSHMGRGRRKLLLCAAASRQSLYDTLGVSPSATEKEIKQAYRRLALKYHPDVNKEPNAQEKFLRIKHAYQTLVEPSMRSKYDSSRQYTNNEDGFSRASSSKSRARPKEEEEFYGLGEFFTDLQVYIEDFFRDLQSDFQKREAAAASGKPKSLWEELAEVGEEFVEFLEKELNIVDSTEQSLWDNRKYDNFDFGEDGRVRYENNSYDKEKSGGQENKGQTSKVENDIKEIEDMLAKLKEELGL